MSDGIIRTKFIPNNCFDTKINHFFNIWLRVNFHGPFFYLTVQLIKDGKEKISRKMYLNSWQT